MAKVSFGVILGTVEGKTLKNMILGYSATFKKYRSRGVLKIVVPVNLQIEFPNIVEVFHLGPLRGHFGRPDATK